MDESAVIRIKEIIELMDIRTKNPKSYFFNMRDRGDEKLKGLPTELGRDRSGIYYDRKAVMAHIFKTEVTKVADKDAEISFRKIFSGDFDPKRKQVRQAIKIMRAKQNKPVTQRQSLVADI